MTVVVGYLTGKSGHAPLNLGVEAARVLQTSLTVVSVVPRPWMTPSAARVDAEFAEYAHKLGTDSAAEAKAYVDTIGADLDVIYRQVASQSAGDGLLDAIEECNARLLVVGSSADGSYGQVVLGSTTDWLLHASPIPVALSPRGYRGSKSGGLTRITCAYSGTPESTRAVERITALTRELDVALRVVGFAIRGRTMFPPEVGLRAEDTLLDTWAEQLQGMLDDLRTRGLITDDVALEVIKANGWAAALDAVDWQDGELLAVGTTSRRSIKGVFLGSHGAKIIRHSPVPVLVLPA